MMNELKVIFLDIDGVLNSANWLQERELEDPTLHPGWDDLRPSEQQDARSIDPNAVARLNRIVYDTGAVVVISSAWRLTDSLVKIDRVLKFRGFCGDIIGATPTLGTNRGFEIAWWLDLVPVTAFVVIDDCDDMEADQPFVLINPLIGLSDYDVEQAIEHLRGTKSK